MSDINITPNSPNTVTIQNADNIITVTDTSKHTEVDITQEITDIVNVVASGPQGTQGIQGPAGQGFDEPFTGSLIISGSIEVIGAQTITGSLTISGSSTFTNIGPAIFSGSVTTTQGFTGSLSGTASYADMATTASHALFAISASHEIVKEVSSSHANTADIAGGLQGQPSINVTNITASSNISSSANIFATSFTGIFNGALSSSAQIATNISGAFTASSASFSTRITSNEVITSKTLISSSAQIASDISGAFASPFTAAGISGSFNAASSSFSTRVTTNETNITTLTAATSSYLTSLPSGVLSSSAQIASNISGAFSATSSSLASRTSTLENKTSYSGSFSGSFEGNGSGLTNIPASGITGLNLSQIASGSATASISPNLGLVVNTNVSSSAVSTASFGTYLGDGSQLSGISTTPFPFTGDAQITGSLIVSGSFIPTGKTPLSVWNVIIGREAGEIANAQTSYNVFVGGRAGGQDNDFGDQNVLVGYEAGYLGNQTGNTSIGYHAGRGWGTTGTTPTTGYNTSIGYQSGYGAATRTTAIHNTFLGAFTGRNVNPYGGGNGNGNVLIGYYAGYENVGDGNIIIGSGSIGEDYMANQLRIGNGSFHIISGSLTTGDITLQGNVSSSAVSTASFGTYLGDGSQLTGISSGITWIETTQSADFTAEINKGYLVDSSGSVSGSVTVTLPSSPVFGDQVAVLDVTGFAPNFDIIMTSSIDINGQDGGQKLKNANQSVYLLYTNDTLGWKPIKGINGGTDALVTAETITFDWLLIAGGGGGGSVNGSYYGGGGGAGGLRTSYGSTSGGGASAESSIEVLPNSNITITVGAGGAGATGTSNVVGAQGNLSSITYTTLDNISTYVSASGGGGGGGNTSDGTSGGSGGGGSESDGAGQSGIAGQGYAGGAGSESANRGGGGGGASAVGGSTDGGAGLAVSITGASVTYAGGGASSGTGGSGGGGDAGTAGTTNTGGGAGGTSNTTGINGGSGIIILRYPNDFTLTIGGGLAHSTATDGSDKVTSFTSGTGVIYFT